MIRSTALCIAVFAVPSLAGMYGSPAVYGDPTGDIATGNSNLDITQLEITDNGYDLVVRMTVDSHDGDWGKYMLFMDVWDGGSGDNDNPWGRNISGLAGMDIFVGSWLDNNGGAAAFEHGPSGWGSTFAVTQYIDWMGDAIEWHFSGWVDGMIKMGITGFDFEAATTGGNSGDPAIDLLGGEGVQDGWGGTSASTDLHRYDFSTIPTPGALALLGLAGLAGRRRRH